MIWRVYRYSGEGSTIKKDLTAISPFLKLARFGWFPKYSRNEDSYFSVKPAEGGGEDRGRGGYEEGEGKGEGRRVGY